METMNIALPPALKEFVQTRVAEGGYGSVSEYMRELIRADQEQAAKALLEAEILKGLRSGESALLTEREWAEIRSEVLRRHQARGRS